MTQLSMDLIYTTAIQWIGRTLHWKENLKDKGVGYDGVSKPYTMDTVRRRWQGSPRPAPGPNLISSLTDKGTHAPALDIDFPAHLVPSSTPGHFHLYLDKELSWSDYAKVLRVLTEVGILEQGFFDQAIRFEQTYLRLPHVKKEP